MSIEVVSRKSGKRYRARVSIDGHIHRSKWFNRIVDARMAEDRYSRGEFDQDIPTFKEASDEWMECHSEVQNKLQTQRKNKILLKQLNPVFGYMRLNDIKRSHITSYLSSKDCIELSPSSIQHRISIIKSIYNWYMTEKELNIMNPCKGVKKPKEGKRPIERWELHEAIQFLEYTEKKYNGGYKYLVYLLALNTGARWGEILALDWSSIDLRKNRILIHSSWNEKDQIVESTKNWSYRYVGINEILSKALNAIPEEDRVSFLFKAKTDKIKVIDRRNFRTRYFYPDMENAKVPRIRFHALRSTYASLYMEAGGLLSNLQHLLGHSDPKMTQVYADFSPDHASRTANVMNIGTGKLCVIEGGKEGENKDLPENLPGEENEDDFSKSDSG